VIPAKGTYLKHLYVNVLEELIIRAKNGNKLNVLQV
jgi:hypothetical protein